MKCRICGSDSALFGEARVLDRHPAQYYRCETCGFMQVGDPYWLPEAYSDAITRSDIGLLGRNIQMSAYSRRLLRTCLDPNGKFIDYGGGYGVFVRLMRDSGFDFYRYDPLCTNMFAEGFDAGQGQTYALLTAWEVFEHLQDPLQEIEKMASFSRNLLFSTVLLPQPPRPLDDWWYYGLEHGQHISFYTEEALRRIAGRFGLRLHYSSGMIHFMGDAALNPLLVRVALDDRFRWLRRLLAKPAPPSLLESDFHSVTGKHIE